MATNETIAPSSQPKVVFLLTGQVSVYIGMGRDLYDHHPAFRDAINQCVQIFDRQVGGQSLLSALYDDEDLLSNAIYGHASIFAVQVALAELWKSFGVAPDCVIGHSLGECAAAVIAGVMSIESGLHLIISRAKLLLLPSSRGGMIAVTASAKNVSESLRDRADIQVAAYNSPSQTVIAGNDDALAVATEIFGSEGLFSVRLATSYACHCDLMQPILDDLRRSSQSIEYSTANLNWISTVTGQSLIDTRITADYWVENTKSAVLYQQAVETALESGYDIFIELGPERQLLSLGAATAGNRDALWLPSLAQGNESAWKVILESLSRVFVRKSATPSQSESSLPMNLATRVDAVTLSPSSFPDRNIVPNTDSLAKLIVGLVEKNVRTVLRQGDNEHLERDRGFMELGFDSLKGAELCNRLQQALAGKVSMPATILFEFPTIRLLSEHLVGLIGGTVSRNKSRESFSASAPVAKGDKEAVAIVGMACRFPGEARDLEGFWKVLAHGLDAVAPIPGDRWNIDDYYHPGGPVPGKMYVREGGLLKDPVDRFDEKFFSISPREAEWMDPQQRLLLEVVWEALEHANIAPEKLKELKTGVFIGISNSDYLNLLLQCRSAETPFYSAIGNLISVASGRLSYFLGLDGPSISLDNACSSSLTAVHLACSSLIQGESNSAIVGGVALHLIPESTMMLCNGSMLSPDNRCKTFDQSADGFVRGEGCGVIILKRLSDAIRDGDRINAVIRATGINQDGASSGLTAPSGIAQEKLIRSVLERARLQPADIDFIEAHGTGTGLGDPVEVNALSRVFTEDRTSENPLVIGSVKTNI